jgi:hypothetical protein
MTTPTPNRSFYWLLTLVAIGGTLAVFGLVLRLLTQPAPVQVALTTDGGTALGGRPEPGGILRQRDTVAPRSAALGSVYFPLPFHAPPHLKLTCAQREYRALNVTEAGFVWEAKLRESDFKPSLPKDDLERLLGSSLNQVLNNLRPDLLFEDFTWEAAGQSPDPATALPKTFTQKGKFGAPGKQESIVYFPIPFASPPNVTFDYRDIVLVECNEKSFKWKNIDPANYLVEWVAIGVLPKTGK